MLNYERDLPDLRLESEARRLAQEGNELVIVCERQHAVEYQMSAQNITVVRLTRGVPYFRKLNRIIFLLFFLDCFWLLSVLSLHRQYRFDVFHVRDLPMARTMQVLRKLVKRKVILDLYENFPVVLQAFWPATMHWRMRIKKRVFFSLSRWKRYERSALHDVDEVIVVVEEARQRVASLGVPENRITIVGNTLKESFMSFPKKDQALERQYAGKLVMTYIGSIYLSVALHAVIEAMPKILAAVPNAHLLVVGENTRFPEFKKLAAGIRIESHVTFLDWQPLSTMPAYMSLSSVGLLPFIPDEHHHATVANKLFQYMYLGCPVLVSDCRATARIVSETGCGWVIEGDMNNPVNFADHAIALLKDKHLRYDMGRRGREAVLANYRWSADGDRLTDLYRRLDMKQSSMKNN
jgi:glycosyltransferase involved in cell wall biosynthesis